VWGSYFRANGLVPIFGVQIIAIFYLGKAFAKKNVDMLAHLFSSDRVPQDSRMLMNNSQFTAMLVGNFLNFVVLVTLINVPWLVSLVLFILYAYYLRYNWLQRRVISQVTGDPAHAIREDDPHRYFIERRRKATIKYLFEKPHTAREMIVVMASLAGLALSVAQRVADFRYGDIASYGVLIGGILLNEFLIGNWRRAVEREFDAIDNDQMDDDIRRANERRG
jgi:hypothetical protein